MRILAMSGFVPEQICDTIRFTKYTGDRNISHYCGYAADFISQVWQDKGIDGAVFPKSCDSTRIMKSYLEGCSKFLFQIHVPSFGAPGALECFAESIRAYKEAVEAYYRVKINDINERIDRINHRNASICRAYENIEYLSFADYLERVHSLLQNPLMAQEDIGDIQAHMPTGRRVFVIGSFLSNLKIAEMIERVGLTVVGDTLTESGRLVSMPAICAEGDVYRSIALGVLSQKLSPSQNSFREVLDGCIGEIRGKSAKGVLFITQKYCEAYDYLYASCKPVLDELGIHSMRIVMTDTEDNRKAEIALEAFADML